MTEENTYRTNKNILGKSVVKVGIYPDQFDALCASRPKDKTLTQYINALLTQALRQRGALRPIDS